MFTCVCVQEKSGRDALKLKVNMCFLPILSPEFFKFVHSCLFVMRMPQLPNKKTVAQLVSIWGPCNYMTSSLVLKTHLHAQKLQNIV